MDSVEGINSIIEKYIAEMEEKEKYKEKLERMESRYLALTRNFNLHLDICRSHNTDWQGRKESNDGV